VTKDSRIIELAHLNNTLFSDRLVAKFKLPVEGWRGE
jgi:NAD+ kinase